MEAIHAHLRKRQNIEITDAIKAYAKEKIGKVATHYDQIEGIDVMLTVIKNPSVAENHTAEVTCKLTTGAVHVTETAESMYASIDLVADKLARQVKKFKDKNLGKSKLDSIRTAQLEEDVEEAESSAE